MTKEKQEKSKQPKKGISLWQGFWLIAFVAFLFFVTPLFSFLVSLIPPTIVKDIMSPYYQDVILDERASRLSEPLKYDKNAPYDVLGRDSGVCFKFHSTRKHPTPDNIDQYRLDKAFHGKKIAEIIIVDENKKQYELKETSLTEGIEYPDGAPERRYSIICQRIGKTHIYIPDKVTGIFIRPLEPFTPAAIIWATRKEWH
ncbi:MAG: hypothetical protein ACRBDI_10355 [Alphaproteobacteria bacterium]